jgi:hypothetical protein
LRESDSRAQPLSNEGSQAYVEVLRDKNGCSELPWRPAAFPLESGETAHALMAGPRQVLRTARAAAASGTAAAARAGALPPVAPDFRPPRDGNRRGSTSTPIAERRRVFRRDSDQHEAATAAGETAGAAAATAPAAEQRPPLRKLTDDEVDALLHFPWNQGNCHAQQQPT